MIQDATLGERRVNPEFDHPIHPELNEYNEDQNHNHACQINQKPENEAQKTKSKAKKTSSVALPLKEKITGHFQPKKQNEEGDEEEEAQKTRSRAKKISSVALPLKGT
ncbi:hypothetical protein F5Y10DRAFT_262170 [Nemania abortiva]|nr:hypothetical protein F5Y10DRAFT_262170 [Nemania abortiva]